MKRAGWFLGRAALVVVAFAAAFWAALTLHFAPLVATPWGDGLAALLLLTTVLAFLRLRLIRAGLVSLIAPAVVLVAFLQLRPTNDRSWETEYAVLASVRREGDVVHVSNIRSFKWTSATTAIPRYHDATFNLNDVRSVDLVMSYWAGDAIAHVFVSFALADGRHLAISAETRRAVGQDYSTLGGFFRNYELIYVVADESDLVGVRTNMRGERVYLYRLHIASHIPRQLLLSYLQKIDALVQVPEFYNTVDDNCTSNVISRIETTAGSDGRPPYSWKLLLSGYTDSYAYDLGRLDRNLPFPDLKRRSLIAPRPDDPAGEDFSQLIRENLP